MTSLSYLKYLMFKVVKTVLIPRDALFSVLAGIMPKQLALGLADLVYCMGLATLVYVLLKLVPKSEKAIFYVLMGFWILSIVMLVVGVFL